MNIIHVIENLGNAGGVNSFVYDLSKAQMEMGNEVNIVAILGSEEKDGAIKDINGVPVYSLFFPSKEKAILFGIHKFERLINNLSGGQTTILNVHLKLPVLIASLSKYESEIILVETYHSQYKNYWIEYNICKGKISKYIPCSKSAEDEMVRRFHVNKDKIYTILNGVNQRALRSMVNCNTIRECVPTFISVGRFTDQKNFQITAKAFSMIEGTNYSYNIYGNGPLKDQIIDAINDDNRIRIHDVIPREMIMNLLYHSDMVVMPSLWEGLSIFMLEAMSIGCPLMISNIPALRDVLHEPELSANESWRKCKWGYLVETSNPHAYKNAILHYLNEGLKVKKEMSDSILSIASEYDIYRSAREYLKVYNSILEQ